MAVILCKYPVVLIYAAKSGKLGQRGPDGAPPPPLAAARVHQSNNVAALLLRLFNSELFYVQQTSERKKNKNHRRRSRSQIRSALGADTRMWFLEFFSVDVTKRKVELWSVFSRSETSQNMAES